MAERKKQLGNVAFGGNWSEELLRQDALIKAIEIIDQAVQNCRDKDVEDEALHAALLYVRTNIEKGPMLCEEFFRGLQIPNQHARSTVLLRISNMIKNWAGV